MSLALERQMARWYPLINHPVQQALVEAVPSGVRFPVVPAGRRSGKTERFKRFLAREALRNSGEMYFAGAPTYGQAKKIFWDDLKKLTLSATHPKRPSESDLKIFMPNETEIHIIGFDKPERFEGVPWTGGGIDEIANIKPDAWQLNILPALNTVSPERPDFRAWCWLIGVPDGLNHYYDMAEYAKSCVDPDWRCFHWKSSDILPDDVIEAAKRQMGAKQYRQEYEGSFETVTGKIYEDYGAENYTTEKIQPHEQLHWSHDQNFTPLSSSIAVIRGGNPINRADCKVFFLDEIVLESAISRQSAEEFIEKYKAHKNKHVMIYGDPAGRQGEKHGHASDYTDIEDVLRLNGWTFNRRVNKAAPAIKDRQNSVRAMICNAKGERRLFVNPQTAKYCHKGLSTVQVKKGSSFIEEQTDYQHITTAIGYFIDREFPTVRRISSVEQVSIY
jgi:hypothetical protein